MFQEEARITTAPAKQAINYCICHVWGNSFMMKCYIRKHLQQQQKNSKYPDLVV